MKRNIAAGAIVAALFAVPVLAQQGDAMGERVAQPMTRAALQSRVQAHFAKIDANHDGFVTQEEVRERVTEFREKRMERRGERMEQRGERMADRGQRMEQRAERMADRGERVEQRRGQMFDRLDTNHDGSISRSEFESRPMMRRGEGRGFAGAGEAGRPMRHAMRMRGPRGPMGGGMGPRMGGRMFETLDSNKDGKVSLAEASSRAMQRFDRIDSNRDGIVTPEERRVAREAMRAMRVRG